MTEITKIWDELYSKIGCVDNDDHTMCLSCQMDKLLKSHIKYFKVLEDYVGSELYMSDFQTASDMRDELNRVSKLDPHDDLEECWSCRLVYPREQLDVNGLCSPCAAEERALDATDGGDDD